jgi:hypothetical protein
MKKLLALFMLAIAAACEGPQGPPGLPGENVDLYVTNFFVSSDNWEPIGNDGNVIFYRFLFDLDIGNRIYEGGNVNVFIYLMDEGNEVQAPLPYLIPHVGWTEQYSFDFDRKTIAFYADYINGEMPPPQEFRVVLTY